MKAANPVISALLIVLMLLSGLPLFSPEDANRDTLVGLDDVILQVMDFAETADDPVTFTSQVEKMLATLHAVAGMRAVIKPEQDTSSTNPSFCLDGPYLMSSSAEWAPSDICSFFCEESPSYESVVITPFTPPPRAL